jgi:hypothetical protein
MTTTNLADFGHRERELLIELLTQWNNDGLPEDFYDDGVQPMMNQNSGYVFLTNSEYEVAMINDDTGKLESFYTSPYEGKEGFFNDLLPQYEEMHEEDKEWFKSIANNLRRQDELPLIEEEDEEEETANEDDILQ